MDSEHYGLKLSCETLIGLLSKQLLSEVEAFPGLLQDRTVEENAHLLCCLSEMIESDKTSETEQMDALIAFMVIVCGEKAITEETTEEKHQIGFWLTAALMQIERAIFSLTQSDFIGATFACHAASNFHGMAKGFKLGYDKGRKAPSKKSSDARYQKHRELLKEAAAISKELWQSGSAFRHHQMVEYLQEKHHHVIENGKVKFPFEDLPKKSLLKTVKQVIKDISRPDLVTGIKKSL